LTPIEPGHRRIGRAEIYSYADHYNACLWPFMHPANTGQIYTAR
jgi:hypothetical protein